MAEHIPRKPEPELIDLPEMVAAYAHADFAEINQAFVDRLVALSEGAETARCIELGVGPADIPIRLLEKCPNWRVTAVEGSPPMLGFAYHAVNQAGLAHAIELVQGDAKDTGLDARGFNIIFGNSILHHINNTSRFWREVRRLAASGGLVFLRDLFRPPSVRAARKVVDKYTVDESELMRKEFLRALLASYTPEEVREQLAAVGLEQLTVEPVSDRHMDIYGRVD